MEAGRRGNERDSLRCDGGFPELAKDAARKLLEQAA